MNNRNLGKFLFRIRGYLLFPLVLLLVVFAKLSLWCFFLGLAIMFSGATIGIKATRQLRSAGKGLPWGAFAKDAQASTLVTTGIYAHIRNPITFGYTLLPLGMGIDLNFQ